MISHKHNDHTLPVAALACHTFVYAQQYQDHQHNAHSVKIDRKQSPSTISVHLFFDILLLFFISKNKSHGPEHFRPSQHAPTQPTRTESNKPNTSKTSIPIVLPLDINHPPRNHQTSDLPLFQVHNKLTHSLVSLPPPPSHTHKTFYNPIYLHSFLLPAFSSNQTFPKTLSTMANVTFTATDAPVLTFSTSRTSYKQAGCILQGGRPFMSSCTLQGGRPFMSSCSLQYN